MRLQQGGDDLYPDAMTTVSAFDVAAVLCRRLPDLPKLKKHKLLYYCQAHHLATFGRPLFTERISAWDHGPVVGEVWYADKVNRPREPRVALDEAELNTIGYVLSRYGGLTGSDLETLTHGEEPWQRANENRRPGGSAPIKHSWMRDYYRAKGAPEGDGSSIVLDSDEVSAWLADAEKRRNQPLQEDDLDALRALAGRG
jgi:uncharacterized phage-associated protein